MPGSGWAVCGTDRVQARRPVPSSGAPRGGSAVAASAGSAGLIADRYELRLLVGGGSHGQITISTGAETRSRVSRSCLPTANGPTTSWSTPTASEPCGLAADRRHRIRRTRSETLGSGGGKQVVDESIGQRNRACFRNVLDGSAGTPGAP